MRTAPWIVGIDRLTGAELHVADVAAVKIGTILDALLAVMKFEGDFNPAARNASSQASGLIQFLPSTARSLGTTVDALVKMSFTEQLPYVVHYFSWWKTKLDTVERLYCAVFWPAAIDKPDDYVIARRPSADLPKEQWTSEHKAYMQNAGFDKFGNKDGMITRAEICRPVKAILAAAASHPRIEIPEEDALSKEERADVLELVSLTIQENMPDPSKVTLPDDDEPPTEPSGNA